MTNTHDGSHTWLKYLSRQKTQAEEEIEEFIEEKDKKDGPLFKEWASTLLLYM